MITYTDKSQSAGYDASKWNAQDANEVKIQVNGHLVDTANPHGVTKSQVGLGNVDNTSDLNKPLSTAAQNVLALKEDKITGNKTAHGFQVGEAVYKDSTGWHRSSNADASIASRVDGIVIAITDTDNFVVGKPGTKFPFTGTADERYFLGSGTPNYTLTEPGTGDVGKVLQLLFTTGSTSEATIVLSEPLELASVSNTVTNAMLASDIKIGSLSSLDTTDKSSIVAAINELKAAITALGSGGGSGPTVQILDSFTGADSTNVLSSSSHAPDTNVPASSWAASGGTWGITSNKAYISASTDFSENYLVIDGGNVDGTLECDMTLTATTDRTVRGLLFRYTNSSTWMKLVLVKVPGVNQLELRTSSALLDTASLTLAESATYAVKIVTSGANVKVYIDGVLKIDNSDAGNSGFTGTKVGMMNYYSDGTSNDDNQGTWDNFKFTA